MFNPETDSSPATQLSPDLGLHNPDAKSIQDIYVSLTDMGKVLSRILTFTQKNRQIARRKMSVNGNAVPSDFEVQTIYVDNSLNAHDITITSFGQYATFIVPASSQKWIHPLQGREFSAMGAVNVDIPIILIDEFLPISS